MARKPQVEEVGDYDDDDDLVGTPPAHTSDGKSRPNTNADSSDDGAAYRVASGELRQFFEQIERIRAEKADLAELEKEAFAEAKGRGYDTKVMRKILSDRKRDADDLAEERAIYDMYAEALGM